MVQTLPGKKYPVKQLFRRENLPLLEDPILLNKAKEPRIVTRSDMEWGKQHMIVGSGSSFHEPERAAHYHQVIGELCGVSKEAAWISNGQFLGHFFREFFRDRGNKPAGISIAERRLGYRSQNEQVGQIAEQVSQETDTVGGPGCYEDQLFSLGKIKNLPCDGLKMSQNVGVKDKELLIIKQHILRIVSGSNNEEPKRFFECWWFPGTQDDVRRAREGKFPTTEQINDEITGVVLAHTVSMYWFADDYAHLMGYAFHIKPGIGSIVDIRYHIYELDYFFLNCGPTHAMLMAALDPNSYSLI